jgi:hypothetical protein
MWRQQGFANNYFRNPPRFAQRADCNNQARVPSIDSLAIGGRTHIRYAMPRGPTTATVTVGRIVAGVIMSLT